MKKRPQADRKNRGKSERRVFALVLSVFACWCFLCPLCPSSAWSAPYGGDSDFDYDIRSMIQMNPDFSTYSDAGAPDGVVWLKRVHYGAAREGGIERQTMWILLGREGLPSKWLTWNVPVPKDGSVEILEAAAYSMGSGEKIASALSPDGGAKGSLVSAEFAQAAAESVRQSPEGFILVLHYKEIFGGKLSIEDLVWTSESLPVWETVIRVAVPAGQPFYHFSSQGADPEIEQDDGQTVYEWRVLNTPAEVSPSIRAAGREYVVFGSRDEERAFARFIKAAESAPLPPTPKPVRDMLGGRNEARVAENVLAWLYEQPEINLTSEPREVPPEAPWTAREKVLLARKWLKEGGVDSRLFWRLAYAPENGKPSCAEAIAAPVIGISQSGPRGRESVFYNDMERAPVRTMALPEAVYGLRETGEVLERRMPVPQKASDNSLSVRLDMSLSEDGVLSGNVQFTARNEWKPFLFPEKNANGGSGALMNNMNNLMNGMFAQTPRYSGAEFRESASESVVSAVLADTQTIMGTDGVHIMLTPPPLVPRWLRSLASGPSSYNLNFPFTMDVRIVIAMPQSTLDVILPSPAEQNAGKIRYSESYRLDRRKRFIAEARLTADATAIADDDAAALYGAIANWEAFMTRYLPVRLRAK